MRGRPVSRPCPRKGGDRALDEEEPRRALTLIMKTENRNHGAGTHWVEAREVSDQTVAPGADFSLLRALR